MRGDPMRGPAAGGGWSLGVGRTASDESASPIDAPYVCPSIHSAPLTRGAPLRSRRASLPVARGPGAVRSMCTNRHGEGEMKGEVGREGRCRWRLRNAMRKLTKRRRRF